MKCDLSLITILITLILPIGIDCCSYNQYDINCLMNYDPNYQQNPCYIQWKAEQDAKQKQVLKRREELDNSISANDEVYGENRRREEENSRNTNITTEKKKQSGLWSVLGIIFVVLVLICCCGACLTIPKSYNTRNNHSPYGLTAISMTPVVTIYEPVNPTTTVNTNSNITENRRPFSRDSNVPLLPQGVINRQNSLPSYDDAMRMSSASPNK